MNYFEIVKKVALCPGINLKEPQVFDTSDSQIKKIKDAVNQALVSVCSCWDWKFRVKKTTFLTSPGVAEYSNVNGRITRVSLEKDQSSSIELAYDQSPSLVVQSGTPYSYGVEFARIVLYPVPTESKTVTVLYLTDKYALTGDGQTEKSQLELETDVPLIPEKFQDLIVHKAVLNYFARPAKKEYPYYLAQYCERLNQAKLEDRAVKDNTPSIEISGRSQFFKRFHR